MLNKNFFNINSDDMAAYFLINILTGKCCAFFHRLMEASGVRNKQTKNTFFLEIRHIFAHLCVFMIFFSRKVCIFCVTRFPLGIFFYFAASKLYSIDWIQSERELISTDY